MVAGPIQRLTLCHTQMVSPTVAPAFESASIVVSSDSRGDVTVCVSDPAVNQRFAFSHAHRVIHRDRGLANQLLSFWSEVRDANLVA